MVLRQQVRHWEKIKIRFITHITQKNKFQVDCKSKYKKIKSCKYQKKTWMVVVLPVWRKRPTGIQNADVVF